jgi:hypothetical protein
MINTILNSTHRELGLRNTKKFEKGVIPEEGIRAVGKKSGGRERRRIKRGVQPERATHLL